MRILIATKQKKSGSALRGLLERDSDMEVLDVVGHDLQLAIQAQALQPDVVLLDWESPGPPVSALISVLQMSGASPQVLVLSSQSGRQREAVLAAGADAFVSKSEPPQKLLTALRILDLEREHG